MLMNAPFNSVLHDGTETRIGFGSSSDNKDVRALNLAACLPAGLLLPCSRWPATRQIPNCSSPVRDAVDMPAGLFHTLPVIGALMMEGATQDGDRVLIVTAENPERVSGFDGELTKQALERFHLESYRADAVLKSGEPPFAEVQRGADPPDFTVRTENAEHGVDCVVLADHDRRLGYKLMEHLRARLIATAGARDFSGIAGCVLSVWFGAQLRDLPPKRWDESVVEPLLDSMASCRVDHDAVARLNREIAERGFPQVMPPVVATGSTPDNSAGFVANVVLGPTEGVRFSTGLGFDVQLSRPSEITGAGAVKMLQRIVSDHDQPAIQHLLVTAGGPDRSGVRYPAEEAVAAFLLAQPAVAVRARYLLSVSIHLWSARTVASVDVDRVDGVEER